VLTKDGKSVTGMKVEESGGELVLRNPVQPEPIRIRKDAIDEVSDSPTSLMPANIVRLLKDRRDFDDLLRYMLELRGGG
jgi:hypothetical protein